MVLVRLFAHAKLGSVALIHCFGYFGLLPNLFWLISGHSATVCSCKTGLSGTGYVFLGFLGKWHWF